MIFYQLTDIGLLDSIWDTKLKLQLVYYCTESKAQYSISKDQLTLKPRLSYSSEVKEYPVVQ